MQSTMAAHFCMGRRLLLAWLADESDSQEHVRHFERSSSTLAGATQSFIATAIRARSLSGTASSL